MVQPPELSKKLADELAEDISSLDQVLDLHGARLDALEQRFAALVARLQSAIGLDSE
jgi:hypothetical protein